MYISTISEVLILCKDKAKFLLFKVVRSRGELGEQTENFQSMIQKAHRWVRKREEAPRVEQGWSGERGRGRGTSKGRGEVRLRKM